jgi:hypothetical protein
MTNREFVRNRILAAIRHADQMDFFGSRAEGYAALEWFDSLIDPEEPEEPEEDGISPSMLSYLEGVARDREEFEAGY